MKGWPLSILAGVLFAGSLVAWFVEPSRKVDWIPMFVSAVVVAVIAGEVGRLEARLRNLEKEPKP